LKRDESEYAGESDFFRANVGKGGRRGFMEARN
jgi:hypothetical protein